MTKNTPNWEFRELTCHDPRGMGYVSENGIDILHTGAMELSDQQNIAIGKLAASAPALVKALRELLELCDADASFENRDIESYKYDAIVDDVMEQARAALTLAGAK